MANFDRRGMTQAGINLTGKAIGGATIQFTKLVLGDGEMTGEILDLQGVVSPKQNVDVTRIERNDNQCTVGGELLTKSVKQGFFWRECGLYAMDPDVGEILYNYAYSTKPDYIAASDSGMMEEILVSMVATVGSNTNVDVTIDTSMVLTTKKEFNLLNNKVNELSMSVKEFGAKGDGVTDDTFAIQTAVETCNIITFPEGNYLISDTISINKQGVTLRGTGSRDNTVITLSSTASNRYAFHFKEGSYLIENLTFQYAAHRNDGKMNGGLLFDKGSSNMAFISITGCRVKNFSSYGIRIPGSIYTVIDNVSIYTCYKGLGCGDEARQATTLYMTNGYVIGSTEVNVELICCYDYHLTNVIMENSKIGLNANRCRLNLTNCYIEGNSEQDISAHDSGAIMTRCRCDRGPYLTWAGTASNKRFWSIINTSEQVLGNVTIQGTLNGNLKLERSTMQEFALQSFGANALHKINLGKLTTNRLFRVTIMGHNSNIDGSVRYLYEEDVISTGSYGSGSKAIQNITTFGTGATVVYDVENGNLVANVTTKQITLSLCVRIETLFGTHIDASQIIE